MTIKQLRPYPSPEVLDDMYSRPHDHTVFPDHLERVAKTVELGLRFRFTSPLLNGSRRISIADLSCGNAAIAEGVRRHGDSLLLGDFAPGYLYEGPIEETIESIPMVDLFVCCETLEHVRVPSKVLGLIRDVSHSLLLSTPIDAWDDNNPEHTFAWSRDDLVQLLEESDWTVQMETTVDMRPQGYPYCWWVAAAS